jgi:hypothetical protein
MVAPRDDSPGRARVPAQILRKSLRGYSQNRISQSEPAAMSRAVKDIGNQTV